MKYTAAFSGYSTNDIDASKKFYSDVLGLGPKEDMGGIDLTFTSGQHVFIYQKEDHQPATFTVLNLVVDDIAVAVDELVEKGVHFERYNTMPGEQDERGILHGKAVHMGPDIAWFKDPGGNILALIEE